MSSTSAEWFNKAENIILPNINKLTTGQITDLDLTQFVSIFPNLNYLDLEYCCFSSAGLLLLLDNLVSLYYFRLAHFPLYSYNKYHSNTNTNNTDNNSHLDEIIGFPEDEKQSIEKLKFDNNTGLFIERPERKRWQLYLFQSIYNIWPIIKNLIQ